MSGFGNADRAMVNEVRGGMTYTIQP